MKELLRGIGTALASLVVFTPVIIIGIVFNVFYPWVMAIKLKDVTQICKIYYRLFDGTCATIGNMLYDGFAVHYDELGNVYGEWIEDSITVVEDTQFGKKNITISSSVGHLEKEKLHMYPRGHKLSKVLNWAFRQRRHAIGSWEKFLAIEEINERNLLGNIED